MSPRRAFTLIELLIVVAIIAILAAIAVPNFLEAQVRAKVSRTKADQRSIATALESYRVDNNTYINYLSWSPPSYTPSKIYGKLTTPVAYLTSMPREVFAGNQPGNDWNDDYRYYEKRSEDRMQGDGFWDGDRFGASPVGYGKGKTGSQWGLYGRGPDKFFNKQIDTGRTTPADIPGIYDANHQAMEYDPTNGTVSEGDVHRWGP